MPVKRQIVPEEQKGVAGEYESAQKIEKNEITAAKCRSQFSEIVDVDDAFRRQQHALFELLTSADAIWEHLLASTEKGPSERKHSSAMHAVTEAIKENLKLQQNSLKVIEDKLAAVIPTIEQYRDSIEQARGDHAHVHDALDARLKAMAKRLRAIKPTGESRKDKRKESGERKPRALTSPAHSESKKGKLSPLKFPA